MKVHDVLTTHMKAPYRRLTLQRNCIKHGIGWQRPMWAIKALWSPCSHTAGTTPTCGHLSLVLELEVSLHPVYLLQGAQVLLEFLCQFSHPTRWLWEGPEGKTLLILQKGEFLTTAGGNNLGPYLDPEKESEFTSSYSTHSWMNTYSVSCPIQGIDIMLLTRIDPVSAFIELTFWWI